jgi:iron complex outermembrane receptor protein
MGNDKHYVLLLACLCSGMFFLCSQARSEEQQVFYFDIPAQAADASLTDFAKITNTNILYLYKEIKHYETKRLFGYYTAINAIGYLVEGTSLIVEIDAQGTFKIINNMDLKQEKKSKFKLFLESLFNSMTKNENAIVDDLADGDIEIVTVTSQKRQEALRRVPLAISVLSGKQMENSHIRNIENLKLLTPSLNFSKGNTTRNSSIFLRGLGTRSFSIAAEPSVSAIVDGVVLARSGQIFSDLYNVERLEVLRGPQGTLFGKNASAGAVNIITKSPTNEFEGSFDYSNFQGDESRFKGSLSGPINGHVNARVSTYVGSFEGSHKNQFTDTKINGYRRKGAHVLLDYYPNDKLDVRVALDYFDAADNCCIELSAPASVAVRSIQTVNHDKETISLDRGLGGAFTANWDVDVGTITGITAYRTWDNTEDSDRDFMSSVGKVFRSNQANEFQLHELGQQSFKQLSQEIRLTSPSEQMLEFTLGLFYFNVSSDRFFQRNVKLCIATTLQNDVCEGEKSTFINPIATAYMTSNFENMAAFGQAKYNFIDDWHMIFGLRWTQDEVGYTHSRIGNESHKNLIDMKNDPNNPIDFGAPGIRDKDFSNQDSQSKNDVSYKFGIQYDFSSKAMVYATYSTGFKGPAYDVSFSMNQERSSPVGAEKSKSIEIGLKGESKNGKHYIGLAGYYSELDGFQMNSTQNLNGSISSSLRNIGVANNSGFELDIASHLTDNLKLIGGLSFLKDARIKEIYCPGVLSQDPACHSRNNERLMLSPKIKASSNIEYFVPLSNDIFDLSVDIQYAYSGEMFSDDLEDPSELIKSHSIWNANVDLHSKNKLQKLSFIIKNIADKSYPSQVICCATGAQGDLLRYQIPRDHERYIGLNYRVLFN